MTVRQHLLATLGACFAITLTATFALHLGQQQEIEALAQNFAVERQDQLDYTVRETSGSLALFVDDYSGWDDTVNFVATGDQEWARLNLDAVMERFELGAIWVVSADGRLLYERVSPAAAGLTPPALAPIVQKRPWSAPIGGFYRSGDQIVDLRARAIQPTADTDRVTEPTAWLLAARILDADLAATLGRKLQAQVSLIPDSSPAVPEPSSKGCVTVRHDLPDLFDQTPVGHWHATFRITALELGENYNRNEMLVLVGSGVLLFGIVAWSLNRNVLRPLEHIGESLERDSPAPLGRLSPHLAEFTRIANLIRQSFSHREALQREIDERVRLGRDLHDGVIQNLYATGMGIAHGQRLIESQPAQAHTRLEESRLTLNQTMEALRGFINRTEPEDSGHVDLVDACITLFQTLRGQLDCQLDLDLASSADALIPKPQKATLLFIVREGVSNALRHGKARQVAIGLSLDGSTWRLVIRDDGSGCVFPRPPGAGGRGLENILARARDLGGSAHFSASAAGGVELHVDWPARA